MRLQILFLIEFFQNQLRKRLTFSAPRMDNMIKRIKIVEPHEGQPQLSVALDSGTAGLCMYKATSWYWCSIALDGGVASKRLIATID